MHWLQRSCGCDVAGAEQLGGNLACQLIHTSLVIEQCRTLQTYSSSAFHYEPSCATANASSVGLAPLRNTRCSTHSMGQACHALKLAACT